MSDFFRIDSHKLIFHVDRVNEWLRGKSICPIYLEIAPAGGCNQRCIFCALDYLSYQTRFLDFDILRKTVTQAASLGVKSIMYAGEGEPLLNKDIDKIVLFTKKCEIDVAITTNGVLLSKAVSEKILSSLAWIRISLNAATPGNYARVHRARKQDFSIVLDNIKAAVLIKKQKKSPVVIGVQFLMIPENVHEALTLAKILKGMGVDYLTIKPYSQHPLSNSAIDQRFACEDHTALAKTLKKTEDKTFKVIFRSETMNRIGKGRDYQHCLGLPFWAYINACGDIYACSAFLGKKEFCYGNIYQDSFKKIMAGKRRAAIIHRAAVKLDAGKCREVCRLDKINSYLWELKHPALHINFI
ncbi:MAG: radical SAM protein [Candidatus Omnitrophota bacterium]